MAVYTKVSLDDFSRFLKDYDLGTAVALQGISEGVENSNYVVETTVGKFILTLFEKRVSLQELPYFMNVMTHLRKNGVVCPLPVAGRDGSPLRDLNGKKACLTTFLEGKSVKEILPLHCAELGRGMAEMHLAGADFPFTRKNDLSVDGWKTLLAKIGPSADTVTDGLYDEMARTLETLNDDFPDHLPNGIVHADLFPDNVFFLNDNLSGVIDFYFACNDAFAYELAICLNAWCFDAQNWDFNPVKAKSMIDAYQAIRPLSEDEKKAFPLLARGSALRFLLTRTYDWLNRVEGALVTPKNPLEYLKKLRFHMTVENWNEYLT